MKSLYSIIIISSSLGLCKKREREKKNWFEENFIKREKQSENRVYYNYGNVNNTKEKANWYLWETG